MNDLEQYLNDHLTGSAAALNLLEILAEQDVHHREFFVQLRAEIEGSRDVLLRIMQSLGFPRRPWREALGLITSKGGQFRLRWHGLSPGKLGLLEALEVLELGIHGQMLLWITLKNLSCSSPTFEPGVNLDDLIAKAETQRSQVESKRLVAALRTFGNT